MKLWIAVVDDGNDEPVAKAFSDEAKLKAYLEELAGPADDEDEDEDDDEDDEDEAEAEDEEEPVEEGEFSEAVEDLIDRLNEDGIEVDCYQAVLDKTE